MLSFIRDSTDQFVAELAGRPAGEAPFAKLTNAFRVSFRTAVPDAAPGTRESPYLLVIKLIDKTPALLAGLLRYMHDRDGEIVRVLAAGEGVDPETDRRPRLAVLAYGALTVAATREWRMSGEDSGEAMRAAFDAYAEQLGAALFQRWT